MTARRTALSVAGWVFGISLSVLFVSLWGRAVVTDTATLGESLAPMSRSALVGRYLTEWMTGEMSESGAPAELVEPMAAEMFTSPRVGATLDRISIEVVAAAASTDPDGSSIEMAPLVAPAIPEVARGLSAAGVQVSESQLVEIVEGLDPLLIRSPGTAPLVGAGSPAATHLGTATLLSIVTMGLAGWGYVALSPRRVAALRTLATRVAVGGLSFGVMLRLGAWVLDPQGGRAPLRQSLSEVAGSKWLVPFRVGLVAALFAVALYLIGRLLKRAGVTPWPVAPSRPRVEPVRSRSGSS